MWEEKTFADGRTFVSSDVLTCGDYGGSGSVGAANIKSLLEEYGDTNEQIGSTTWRIGTLTKDGWEDYQPDKETRLIVVSWPYSTEQAWVIKDDDTAEMLAALENYPVIDEDEMSRVEMEWETEAWHSWIKSDLLRALGKQDEDLEEKADEMSDEGLFECYRAAMDETNTYPEAEYNGVHVDIDRIADSFIAHVRTKVTDKE